MGMLIYDALVLARSSQYLKKRERVLTLGVPRLYFDRATFAHHAFRLELPSSVSQGGAFAGSADFFRTLGFASIDALDISDYEGADIIGDLNDKALQHNVSQRYDLIFDAGTTEHIFNYPAALSTINALLEPGGIVVHTVPANGFMDHGFWQISPDALKAFYGAAGYTILTCALFVLGTKPAAVPADVNFYRTRGRDFLMKAIPEALLVFAAQKGAQTLQPASLAQDYYKEMHGAGVEPNTSTFFLPFGSIRLNGLLRTPLARALLRARAWLGRTRHEA